MAPINSQWTFFHSTEIVPVKAMEWLGAVRLVALWITLLVVAWGFLPQHFGGGGDLWIIFLLKNAYNLSGGDVWVGGDTRTLPINLKINFVLQCFSLHHLIVKITYFFLRFLSTVQWKTGMNGLSYNTWVYSMKGTSENIQASGLVTWLRLNVTEALSGEPVLYNRFMHITEMVRWPSPLWGALWCVALTLL